MNTKLLIITTVACLNLVACGEESEPISAPAPIVEVYNGYNASLAQGIQFSEKPDYPAFIKSVSGMSGFEPIGRWTEGEHVDFTFIQNLPAKFTLELDMAPAFGPEVGKTITIQVGSWTDKFVSSDKPKKINFNIETTIPTDSIKFTIPEPTSPLDLGVSEDARKVGIMFKRLSILSDAMVTMIPAVTTAPVIEPTPVPATEEPTTDISTKPAVEKSTQIKKPLDRKKSVKTTPDSALAK